MKTYLVGGSIRDKLLGLEPKDNDFVVVGCSPQDMLDKGFKMVGKDFPVFIHSVSGDEYALARKERKIGRGYYGFECEWEGVTLEEDLSRRDLTINAMAQEVVVDDNGKFEVVGGLVDPFGGVLDLTNKYLRETTNSFSEDPLRILRVARFLARYKDFQVTPSLLEACKRVYISGELEYLTPERVWLEMEKALKENHPERFFEFLFKFNIFKEVGMMYGVPQKQEHHPEVEDL
jgi:tRNA nucleotidyltransferase (CCA-adding enzyme)|tara:strand:- start:1018 stop:1716 length:699 start_codon:yes stop_codon:yes gene_type:complete